MNTGAIIAIAITLLFIFIGIGILIWLIFFNQSGCVINSDCGEKEICVTKKCIPVDCKKNEDCNTGQLCMKNKCVASIICDAEKPCPNGKSCKDGICIEVQCGTGGHSECPPWLICKNNKCEPKPCTTSCQNGMECKNGFCTFPPNSYFLKTNDGKYLSLTGFSNNPFELTNDKKNYFIIEINKPIKINTDKGVYFISSAYTNENIPILTTDTTYVLGYLIGTNIITTKWTNPSCNNPTTESSCYLSMINDKYLIFTDQTGKGCPCGKDSNLGATILNFTPEIAM